MFRYSTVVHLWIWLNSVVGMFRYNSLLSCKPIYELALIKYYLNTTPPSETQTESNNSRDFRIVSTIVVGVYVSQWHLLFVLSRKPWSISSLFLLPKRWEMTTITSSCQASIGPTWRPIQNEKWVAKGFKDGMQIHSYLLHIAPLALLCRSIIYSFRPE